ncbi:MAG: VOC family protein [Puniceicoccaceae bacterium]
MDLKRIDHLALVSADSTKSREWYCGVLGMEWIYQDAWEGNPVFLRKGETCLAIFQAGRDAGIQPREGIRLDHFAFLAESMADFKQACRELGEKGIPFDFQDHEISHSIYFKDPDGHVVEITTYDLHPEK